MPEALETLLHSEVSEEESSLGEEGGPHKKDTSSSGRGAFQRIGDSGNSP